MSEQPSILSFLPNKDFKATIFIDTREVSTKNGKRIADLLSDLDIEVRKQKLDFGDYLVGKEVAIERKTVMDFASTLTNRFLFDQIFQLRDAYPKALVIIEGYMGLLRKFRKIKPEAINGALFALANTGIPIVPTIDYKDTAIFLSTAAKQLQKEKQSLKIRQKKKTKDLSSQQIFIVSGLPHIGSSLAEAMLKRFKSVRQVFNVSEGELQNVDGIGNKIAEDITFVINAEYE
jgi:ERCC4-type nuclease